MKEPYIDYEGLALEYQLTAIVDNLPDTCKTQRFWAQLRSVCPDALLNTLLVGARVSPHPPTLL